MKNFLSKLVEMIRLSCNQVIILYIILQNKGVHFSSISLEHAKHKIVLFNKIEHINSSAVLWLFDCKKKKEKENSSPLLNSSYLTYINPGQL